MDARFNKSKLINRIQQIGLHRDRIELHNLDAILLVRMLRNKLPEKTLFYLDPPYYSKGRKLYLNYYRESDHVAVANEIGKIVSQKWVVTYDSVPFIEQLYTNHRQSTYTLNYTACKLHKGNELMIFSDNLIVPALDTKN
jgi:DNA adenine methylase